MANKELELDTRGLNCPFPVLRARKMLRKMYPGQKLHVIATDPQSMRSLTAYCGTTGDTLVESRIEGKQFFYTIKKI